MNISILDSYEAISQKAASLILKQLRQNKKLLLCAATGDSPTRTYAVLKDEFDQQPDLFSELSIIKLDEWGGIPMTDPGTCESYLQQHVIRPLHVAHSRYISFDSQPPDVQEECERKQKALDQYGPIDICILGIGQNGHIALNEPSDSLEPHIHQADLSDTTLQHGMVKSMIKKPSFGLTLGMADIFRSKMILLLISGAGKKGITRSFLSRKLTTRLPASLLHLHSNVECLVDKAAYGDQK